MSEIQLGDSMIVTNGRDKPMTGKVTYATKSDWIKVTMEDGNETQTLRKDKYKKLWKKDNIYAYPYTETEFAQEQSNYENRQKRIEERNQEQKERQRQSMLLREAQLEEVKKVCNQAFQDAKRETLPDGSRLVIIRLPVKPEYIEYKMFEIIMIRIKDQKSWEDGSDEVEASQTAITQRGTSFGSYSSTREKTDDEAIWEIIRYHYHNW